METPVSLLLPLIAAALRGRTSVGEQWGRGMSTRRMGFGPTLMVLLSIVVVVQSLVLAWIVLRAEDPESMLADLRASPVETVVEMCLPAEG